MFEYDSPMTKAAQAILQGQQQNLAAQQARQQLAMNAIALEDRKRAQTEEAGARQAALQAQATPATESGGYTPVQPTDTTASSRALLGMNINANRTQAYDPTKSIGDNDLPAGVNTIPAEKYDAETKRGDLNYSPTPAFNPVSDEMQAKAEAAAKPTVTPGKPANPLAAQVKYWESVNPMKAMELKSTVLKHAMEYSAATDNFQNGLDILNANLGTNYSGVKALNFEVMKDGDGNPVGIWAKGKMEALLKANPNMDMAEAYKQSFTKIEAGGNYQAFINKVAELPPEQQTLDNINTIGAALGVGHKTINEVADNYAKVRGEAAAADRADRADRRFERNAERADRRMLTALADKKAGKASSGYRFTADGELEPIPGGPADQKTTAAAKAQEGAIQSIDTAIDSATKLLKHSGREAATGLSSLTNKFALPGGAAKTFLNDLDTFKSQMFVPMVQQLKGMGQLSDAEGKKLTAAVGNLEVGSSEEAFKANLEKVIDELNKTKARSAKPIAGATTGKQPASNAKGNIAPAGLKAKLPDGRTVTSDGKGGWN